ncbi:MAG: glucose-6-phosphate isomerase [Alphaproteobacteria bacterium HGW-Alphaproteobacteria-2]|nr:MAG: glucose-6-phosphate isomerase [Alphaproteobacteria bacterium HGW-Alphaproteobacteria-2]
MRRLIIPAGLGLAMLLAGCEGMTRQEQLLVGGFTGAALGVVTASALGVGTGWVVVGALSGAAVGTLVARDNANNRCAYARRDGRYDVRRCS